MASTRAFIGRAFTTGQIKHPGDSIPPEEINTALDVLNEMLADWRNKEVDVGLGVLTLDTEFTAPAIALRAARFGLASDLRDEWGLGVNQNIELKATTAFQAIRARQSRTPPYYTEPGLPGTTPRRTLRDQLFP